MHPSFACHVVVCVPVSAVYILTLVQFFVYGKILMCKGAFNAYATVVNYNVDDV